MIDPLLSHTANHGYPPPPPQLPKVQKKNPVPMSKKHPALSARILAVGLSTTAFIGMTTGYTMAQKQPATQPLAPDATAPASSVAPSTNTSPASGVVQSAGQETIAANPTPVIQIPVPATAGPATPGDVSAPAYLPAQTRQKSSGSN